MKKKTRNVDRIDFLIRRLIILSALTSLYFGVAFLLLLVLLTGASLSYFWESFAMFAGAFTGAYGLLMTFSWLLGVDRYMYYRKLQERRRIANKRREPCRLSIELGIDELSDQVTDNPPTAFVPRMRRFLATLKAVDIKGRAASLWAAEDLEYQYRPPRPASFFRRLLQRIQRVLHDQ